MLKVTTILVDEVPDNIIDIALCPVKPVFNRRLDIKDRPTVKLSRVHFPNLILLTVLTTVDGSENQRILMERMTVELPAIGQLKDSLANLDGRTVNLIKEENHSFVTSLVEPIRRVEGGRLTRDNRQTNKVTFRHLRGTTLYDWQTQVVGGLIDHAGLTNTVATTEQDGFANRCDERGDSIECFEIYSHCFLS
jgi:hypothetical protein